MMLLKQATNLKNIFSFLNLTFWIPVKFTLMKGYLGKIVLWGLAVFCFCPDIDAKHGGEGDGMLVAFWNLENFFDCKDDGGGGSDHDFSYAGVKKWTPGKFTAKCNAVAKTVLYIGEKYGRMPDVVGVAEVENAYVLSRLCSSGPLKKAGYSYVHYESPDHRGIDVGLLYRKELFEVLESGPFPLVSGGDTLRTRSVLSVKMLFEGRLRVHFLVNHHPSKFSGAELSEPSRVLAVRTMLDAVVNGGCEHVVAMGDFNDWPYSEPMEQAEGMLVNLGRRMLEDSSPFQETGTIRYEGKWELIDYFLVSPSLAEYSESHVASPSFLLEWDRGHAGYKPVRTYSGPRYNGGVSDHLPVVLRVYLDNIVM